MKKRPRHLAPPHYLSKSPPVPTPRDTTGNAPDGEEEKLDPTRYGDWERNGIAVDF